jgi:hypothetical protein
VGALANLGYCESDQTVGNILERHGLGPAPKRSQTIRWKDFIASHMSVMAGMDFFTVEVLTWRGLATYYVLFLIQLETCRVSLAGLTRHPTEEWMQQMARNVTDPESGLYIRGLFFCMTGMQVLRYVPNHANAAWCATADVTALIAEPECICRTLGSVGQRGVPRKVDPVWRRLASANSQRVH